LGKLANDRPLKQGRQRGKNPGILRDATEGELLNGAMAMPKRWKSSIITEEVSMGKKRISPVHPGVYLKELLNELKLSQYRLARELGVPAMRINHVVNGKRQ